MPTTVTTTKAELFERLEALLPEIAARNDEVEDHGGLPDDLKEKLREAGTFRMSFPESMGGAGFGFVDRIEYVSRIAEASPSTAWVVSLLSYAGLLSATVPPDIADELFPNPDVTMVFARGNARAVKVDGGVVVDGSFGWVSGARDTEGVNLRMPLFDEDGAPILRPDGSQVLCGAFFTTMDGFEIIDTWADASGLRGSGTVTVVAKDAFVPDRHWVDMRVDGEVPEYWAPLGRYPMLLFLNGNAVPLGTSKAILDEVEATLVGKKTPAGASVLTLTHVARDLMHARGVWQAAHALTYELARTLDELLFADRPVSDELMARAATTLVLGVELCRQSADEALALIGSDHVFRSNRAGRLYNDLRVGASHVIHRRDFLDRAAYFRAKAREADAEAASRVPASQVPANQSTAG